MSIEKVLILSFTLFFILLLVAQGPVHLLHFHSLATDNIREYLERRKNTQAIYYLHKGVQEDMVMTNSFLAVMHGDMVYDILQMAKND